MTEVYEIKINVMPTKRDNIYKYLMAIFGLITLIFIIPCGLVHIAFIAGVIVFLILAILFNQLYLIGTKQYIYDINSIRFTISRTNRFGRTKRIENVLLKDCIKIEDTTLNAINNINEITCYFDVENTNNEQVTILYLKDKSIALQLDTYANCLLHQNIEGKL